MNMCIEFLHVYAFMLRLRHGWVCLSAYIALDVRTQIHRKSREKKTHRRTRYIRNHDQKRTQSGCVALFFAAGAGPGQSCYRRRSLRRPR